MSVSANNRDVKKLLGNPKITFILGGPASGKGTQCAKLVEEFGYMHISTGDLMRAEIAKGSKEGERIKKIVNDGALVPFELTVEVLINGMIANPAKNYLIDGFPRAVEQAIYFEQNVAECQNVIFYDVPEETLIARCSKRAETSGRADDNMETLLKRFRAFNEQSKPVVDLYKKFGKVHEIDARGDIEEVYEQTRKGMIPQVYFLVGPKCSGKTSLGSALADRASMHLLNFNQFLAERGLTGKDDETTSMALIKHLIDTVHTRVLLEDFPQNEFQAKFFVKNCIKPERVFQLECSKDLCQERMLKIGRNNPRYLPSALLAKKIQYYHANLPSLIDYLSKETTCHSISTESTFEKSFKELSKTIEPVVIHVRSGNSSNELRKEITDKLQEEQGFINLEVNNLISLENERRTSIGIEFNNLVQSGKILPAEIIVRMLRKIIYSGSQKSNKFILSSFPDIIEQAREFEKNCASITSVIYATNDDPVVEIKNNNLDLFNIDTLFQKEFRLKTMNEWDGAHFNALIGNKISFILVTGRQLSGKTTISKFINSNFGYHLFDYKVLEEELKKKLSTEDEPVEEVPLAEYGKEILRVINENKAKGIQKSYVIDVLQFKDFEIFQEMLESLGTPEKILICTCQDDTIYKRIMARDESDAVNDDQKEEVDQQKKDFNEFKDKLILHYNKEVHSGRCKCIDVDTDQLLEITQKAVRKNFAPQVILVHHEKRLAVDTACSNLAIKYNMIYLSVYQLIKSHIENQTEWGKRLKLTKKPKNIKLQTQVKDEFYEIDYSAVHFDLNLVIELVKETILKIKSDQNYVLLEGLVNSGKLIMEDDQLELRFMDEFFMVEKHIGEVIGVIGLQYNAEKHHIEAHEIIYEEFPEPPPPPVKVKGEGDEEEEEEEKPPEEEEEGEEKAPKFKIEDHKWTITDRKPRNLPQLFMACKGINAEFVPKNAEHYSSTSYDAVSKCLDDFCGQVCNIVDGAEKYLYFQVLFQE